VFDGLGSQLAQRDGLQDLGARDALVGKGAEDALCIIQKGPNALLLFCVSRNRYPTEKDRGYDDLLKMTFAAKLES